MTITHDDKVLYAISALAGAEDDTKGPDLEEKLFAKIEQGLTAARHHIGRWEVAWGPAVLQTSSDGLLQNAMYVAHSLDRPSRYVIAIAGTNPESIFDWLVEDFVVSVQVPWIFAAASAPDAKISFSTALGLSVLLTMKPTGARPGAGTRLLDFVGGVVRAAGETRPELVTTGHSLGGALSATMALLLHDTQGVPFGWDPEKRAAISSMPTAGPTAGNLAFALHSDAAIGEVTRRLSNSMDVIPHAWNEKTLAEVKTLYAPSIHDSLIIDALIDHALHITKGKGYTQVNARTPWLPGEINTSIIHWYDLPVLNFVVQLAYQHTIAYETFFGFEPQKPADLDKLKAAITPASVARALSRGQLPLPPELQHLAGPIHRSQIAVGQQWVDAPAGADDPRMSEIVRSVMAILESAAPGAQAAR